MADAVKAAAKFYKVVLENERVRVLEFRGKPGDKTEMHSHPGHVAVATSDGKYKFTSLDGQIVEAELKAGQAMYMDAIEHTTEVTGTTEARAILVEVK